MTHGEQRIYLIQALLAEDERYRGIAIPSDEQGQRDLLQSDECADAEAGQSGVSPGTGRIPAI